MIARGPDDYRSESTVRLVGVPEYGLERMLECVEGDRQVHGHVGLVRDRQGQIDDGVFSSSCVEQLECAGKCRWSKEQKSSETCARRVGTRLFIMGRSQC